MSAGILERMIADAVAPLRAELAELRAKVDAVKAPTGPDDLISIAEAAALRRCSVAALHKAVQRGRLPVVREGRSVFVRRGDL